MEIATNILTEAIFFLLGRLKGLFKTKEKSVRLLDSNKSERATITEKHISSIIQSVRNVSMIGIAGYVVLRVDAVKVGMILVFAVIFTLLYMACKD